MNLAPQQWLQLKQSTRQALVKIFKIPRSSYTHVVGNQLESDGHTYEDLKAISLEEMKLLTHSASEDYFEQFDLIVKMVESEGNQPEISNTTNAPAGAENATTNEPATASSSISGEVAAGVDTGAKEGSKQEAPVSEETVLPVPGGVDEVNRGSDEPVPNTNDNNTASVAAEAEQVDAKKPKVNKPVK